MAYKTRNFLRPGIQAALRTVRDVSRRMRNGAKLSKGGVSDLHAATTFIAHYGSAADKASAKASLRRAEMALMTVPNRRRSSRRRSTRNGWRRRFSRSLRGRRQTRRKRRTTKNRRRTSRR